MDKQSPKRWAGASLSLDEKLGSWLFMYLRMWMKLMVVYIYILKLQMFKIWRTLKIFWKMVRMLLLHNYKFQQKWKPGICTASLEKNPGKNSQIAQ